MKKTTLFLFTIFISVNVSFAQDIIYKTDGTEIKAKILELTTETIKYKKFEQLEGPTRNILLSDVFMIIYEDGTKEVIKKRIDIYKQPQVSTNVIPKTESIKNNISLNNQDLCFKGQQDAARYYTGYTSAANWTGAATILGGAVLGLIPAIACSTSEPQINNLTFPDSKLVKNPSYYSCYTQEAKRIKSRKVWTMFGIGVAIDFSVALLIISASE